MHFINELKAYDQMLKCSLFISFKKNLKLMQGNILYAGVFFAPCNFRPLTLANSFLYTVPIQELKLLDTKSCVIIWFVEIHLMRLIRFMTKL